MFFAAEIKSLQTKSKTIKDKDGIKTKVPIYELKITSASIDYEQIQQFDSSISATLLNIQPMPFKTVVFESFNVGKINIECKLETNEEDISYNNVFIKNLSIKINQNIPVYTFTIIIDSDCNIKPLSDLINTIQKFEIEVVDEPKGEKKQ